MTEGYVKYRQRIYKKMALFQSKLSGQIDSVSDLAEEISQFATSLILNSTGLRNFLFEWICDIGDELVAEYLSRMVINLL
eukprot:TRINITY_DN16540_c0_g1_i1.p1 TRINITY_DN16540_c0_g1~~TRINITY_DN16540_c0_g1_i1.p1  ORF type:complete len:80 (+),score=16.21 TRINITY_DN16540_c0_g1_i1:92-331(+)